MQKDYWNLAKRNFRAMAVASVIFIIIFGLGFTDSSNPDTVRMYLLASLGFFVLTFIIFLVIASLFKKHSPKAIPIAYTYLSLSLIYSLVNNFVLSSPSDFMNGIVIKILGYVVLVYLFFNVYKASKQNIPSQTPTQGAI